MREVGSVMHNKVINGFTTCTRMDSISVNGELITYEVIARCTIQHPHDARSIDMFVHVGTDYTEVVLLINGMKRQAHIMQHAGDSYAMFATLVNKFDAHNSVVFDGVFISLFGAFFNSMDK